MPLFPKNIAHFGVFTNEMEYETDKQDFSNKVIIFLNANSVLIFQHYKNARKTTFKKYYTIGIRTYNIL